MIALGALATFLDGPLHPTAWSIFWEASIALDSSEWRGLLFGRVHRPEPS